MHVPICRPSALSFPSCLGLLTVGALPLSPLRVRPNSKNMLSQGSCGVSSSGFLSRCCVDYLFQIVVFSLLIQSGWNISQHCTNLGSSQVSVLLLCLCPPLLPLSPALTLHIAPESISGHQHMAYEAVPTTRLNQQPSCHSPPPHQKKPKSLWLPQGMNE